VKYQSFGKHIIGELTEFTNVLVVFTDSDFLLRGASEGVNVITGAGLERIGVSDKLRFRSSFIIFVATIGVDVIKCGNVSNYI
jgi:hypothetical protein